MGKGKCLYEQKHIVIFIHFGFCTQWIAECEGSIEDPSLSEWRREKLLEGVKLYEEYIQQCQQEIVTIDTALLQLQADLDGELIIVGVVRGGAIGKWL